MNATQDEIVSATDNLERVLAELTAGKADDQTAHADLDRALADVATAVRDRDAELKNCGGQLVDVDRPLLASPTMDRLANELRHEFDGVLDEVAALRNEARVLTTRSGSGLGELRGRVARLVKVLERFEREESTAVQDAVNTDIGGAD